MFKFSGFKKNYFLGVDFGTSSIKVVELFVNKSGIHLSNYGWVDLPIGNKGGNNMTQDDKIKEIAGVLKKMLGKMNIKSSSAYISMGAFKGLSLLIEIYEADKESIEDAVRMEANKYVPVSLDEVYLSWDIVSRKKKNKNFIKNMKDNLNRKKEKTVTEVLLVAAPKDDVRRYEKIIDDVGLDVESLELDIFALMRSLVGNDLGTFLIIDMGAKITNLLLVKKGVMRMNRNINIGGNEITKNIMSGMNISWDRAEDFKKKNNYLSGEGKMMIAPVVDIISKEASRIIEIGVGSKDKIDNLIITGGGFDVVGIDNIFSEKLGIRATMGNPWKKIIIENKKIKERSAEISINLAVATGLALKGIKKYQMN